MSLRTRVTASIFSVFFSLLIGCGFDTHAPVVTTSSHVSGKIFGGQNPISGSTVTVWQMGNNDYGTTDAVVLATTTSASDGTFDIPAGTYQCPSATTQVYITAAGGYATPGYNNPAIMLAAGLGNCSSAETASVEINEVSTVVTAFALNWFYTYDLGGTDNVFSGPQGNEAALALANSHTIPTLLNLSDGTVNPNTSTIKIEAAKIYSLADTLAACVNSTSTSTACTNLFTYTTDPYGYGTPIDTLQAAVVISEFPWQNVTELYNLGVPQAPFVGLGAAPNDWTIGVSYTTPTMGLGIAGTATSGTSSTIDIDTTGRVWVPSNLPGAAGVGYFDPATATFSGPFQASGVTMTQPQYVAIDKSGFVWVTDALSGNIEVIDTKNAVAPAGGVIAGAKALGPVSIDGSGNAFLAYTDSSSNPLLGEITSPSTPTALTIVGTFLYPPTGLNFVANGGMAVYFASTSGSSNPCLSEELDDEGSVPYVRSTDTTTESFSDSCISGGSAVAEVDEDGLTSASSINAICSEMNGCFDSSVDGYISFPEGLATDGYGQEWIANSGNASISTISQFNGSGTPYVANSSVPYLHDSSDGGTMTRPYGLAIDGSGNVWVSNASCVTTTATLCTPTSFVLSELIGAAGPTTTPLSLQDGGNYAGDPPGDPVYEGKGQPMPRARRARSVAANAERSFVPFRSNHAGGLSTLAPLSITR